MYKFVLGLFLILTVITFSTAAATETVGTDAVYQQLEKKYILHQDGRISFEYHHKVRLLTYLAVNRYFGEDFIIYNPRFQTLDILKSITTMADGKRVESPDNAFNMVLPRAVSQAPAYAHLREMVVTHTGLERNAVIDFSYRIESSAEWMPWLMGEEVFSQSFPVQRYKVSIRVPNDVALVYKAINQAGDPDVQQEEGYRLYSWILKDIPARNSEPAQPDAALSSPRVLFSTCSSWNDLVDYISPQRCDCKAAHTAFSPGQTRGKIESLHDIAGHLEDQISNAPFDPVHIGYRTDCADTVFKRGHGHDLERANLLACLFQEEGFDCSPVLLSSTNQFFIDIPSFSQFKQAGVLVEGVSPDPFVMIMDEETLRPARYTIPGHMVLKLDSPQEPLYEIPKSDPDAHFIRLFADLNITPELDMAGKYKIETGGHYHNGYALYNEKKQKRFVEQYIGPYKATDVDIVYLSPDSGTYSGDIEAKEALSKRSSLRRFELPSFTDRSLHNVAANIKRIYAVELMPVHEELQFNLNVSSLEPPEEKHFHITNPVGAFHYDVDKTENGIKVYKALFINQTLVAPQSFMDLRHLLVNYYAPEYNHLYFTEK